MVTGILVGILIVVVAITVRSITTLFHELGHAIPALIFTNEAVTILVGSIGPEDRSFHLSFGRLKIYFRLNIFSWNNGLCMHSATAEIKKRLIIILSGPLISLIIAFLGIGFLSIFTLPTYLKIILLMYIVSSLVDFIVNIVPHEIPIVSKNGDKVFNDGFQLRSTLQKMKYPKEYFEAISILSTNQEKALKTLESLRFTLDNKYYITKDIVDILIDQKRFFEALEEMQTLEVYYKLNSTDYILMGDICMELERFNTAVEYYNKYLYFNFTDGTVIEKKMIAYKENGNREMVEKNLNLLSMLSHGK